MTKWQLLSATGALLGTLVGVIWYGLTSDVEANSSAIGALQQRITAEETTSVSQEKHLTRIEDKLDVVIEHVINEHGGTIRLPPEERGRLLERPH